MSHSLCSTGHAYDVETWAAEEFSARMSRMALGLLAHTHGRLTGMSEESAGEVICTALKISVKTLAKVRTTKTHMDIVDLYIAKTETPRREAA